MKDRIYIIEGPDCSGKTTLAKFLARNWHAPYIHSTFSADMEAGIYDVHNMVLDNAIWMRDNIPTTVVLDRHWPSEWCYSRAVRPETTRRYNFQMMGIKCALAKVVYVWCMSHESRQLHMKMKDPAHPYDDAQFARICDNYELLEIGSRRSGECLNFSYDFSTSGSDLTKVMIALENLQ